jgi:hypothetical protein
MASPWRVGTAEARLCRAGADLNDEVGSFRGPRRGAAGGGSRPRGQPTALRPYYLVTQNFRSCVEQGGLS